MIVHEPMMIRLEDLAFAPYNPRKIGRAEMAALKASLQEHGMVDHPVVQRISEDGTKNVLIGGHQRIRAFKELCEENGDPIEEVWATVIDVDDRTAKRLNIALNKISGEFDINLLGKVLEDIGEMTADEVLGTGFTPAEVEHILNQTSDTPPISDIDASPALGGFEYKIIVECEDEDHQAALLGQFEEQKLKCKALTA